MTGLEERARRVISRCRILAECSEEAGFVTRTFLSAPMHLVHAHLIRWTREAGLVTVVDAAGNLRARSGDSRSRRMLIGSHLDSVRHAGAFDGILGVVMGIELAELVDAPLEIAGFSEEEGVRFGTPFLGSRALVGTLDESALALRDSSGATVADAIRAFGLDPSKVPEARMVREVAGYFEVHIEQGPVLENLDLSVAIVDAIVGQSRLVVTFTGAANHAGTTPMPVRRDALAGAAEWILAVERAAQENLVATVGRVHLSPNASNVIPGSVILSLDVRHAEDSTRLRAVDALLACARQIAERRGLVVSTQPLLDQPAVPMDSTLTTQLAQAAEQEGHPPHRMPSGAGHDAMILAAHIPSAMLFLRSPGGVSHHPDESVRAEDVAAGLAVGARFLATVGATQFQ